MVLLIIILMVIGVGLLVFVDRALKNPVAFRLLLALLPFRYYLHLPLLVDCCFCTSTLHGCRSILSTLVDIVDPV